MTHEMAVPHHDDTSQNQEYMKTGFHVLLSKLKTLALLRNA